MVTAEHQDRLVMIGQVTNEKTEARNGIPQRILMKELLVLFQAASFIWNFCLRDTLKS